MREAAAPEPMPEPEPRKPIQYSAPVTRGAPSVATGSAMPMRITLSPEERQMAHMAYRDLPPEKAERLYMEMKAKMLKARRDGTLNE
jgi:hypothetical protein